MAISEFLKSLRSDFNLVNNSVNDQNINKIVKALENALIIFIIILCIIKCNYKFVFVSGTWDATGGMAAGAQLFIDNISVTQNNKPPLTDNLIEQIRTALTSSRNGYLQPLSVVSNSNELLFTIEQSNVAQLIPINTLDLQARDGHTMARMLVANSLEQISSSRADVGALENRLDSVNDSALNIKQHLASAKSNYTDADYALESARLARSMLLQETSTSLLAKSNGLNEVVLDLLKDK